MRQAVVSLNSINQLLIQSKKCRTYKEEYSLGHLSYVFVSQAHPQVIVFMQQYLLHTGVSNATGLIPEEENCLA